MEETKRQTVKQISVVNTYKILVQHKKTFAITLPIAFVLACVIIFSIPRYYSCTVKLVPEVSSSPSSSLGALASSFGIDMNGDFKNGDAISPELYPDLMSSVDFRSGLFPIHVKSKDGAIDTSYYEYLLHQQKKPWWATMLSAVFSSKDDSNQQVKINPFILNKEQDEIANLIGKKVTCVVDKKTYVISIIVEDQDPLICATIADSAKQHLQAFITEYRTTKARNDMEYYKTLTAEAKADYEKARQRYGSYSDANMDIVLESYRAKRDDLENDMQLKFNTYSTLNTQLQTAKARVQEKTPAFTTLQSATVPIRPAGPKRVIFVGVVLLLTFIGTSLWVLRKHTTEIFF